MPRGWKRTWVKFWVDECLDGSIREELEPDERGVWYDLIIYSAKCRVPGIISANETQPISRHRLAGILNIMEELLERTLSICQESNRIHIDGQGLIHIVNWSKYQSEYQRQKSYQLRKLEPLEGIKSSGSNEKLLQQAFTQGYKEKLQQEFPEIDIGAEFERCKIYWSDQKRKLKSPKLALRNWLQKAREIKGDYRGSKPLTDHQKQIKEALEHGKS